MTPQQHLSALLGTAPDRIIFAQPGGSLSVRELYDQALMLADRLRLLGIGPGGNVAIYLPRGLRAVAAIYGVLAAGACYVPLDTGPDERNQFIIRDAGCNAVIIGNAVPEWLADTGVHLIDIEQLPSATPVPGAFYTYANKPGDNAAILYTSGSTGTPKGVAISHRAVAAFSDWAKAAFTITPNDRVASLAPFHFDLSLFDLFTAPTAGAVTRFVPDALKLSPAKLVDWLHEQGITIWYTVPSILVFMALRGGLEQKSLPRLRQILFAGEVFPVSRLIRLTSLLPHTAFYNLFGPTETNVCLYWPVDRSRLSGEQPIPIGVAACQAEIRVDPTQGELLVRGPCLMSGYWRNGKAEMDTTADGWLHTGDKVSVNVHGEFEYHGRLDRMIKSAGYRIEPAEIEQVLGNAPGVISVAVVGIPDAVSGIRIAAAVTAGSVDQRALQVYAGKKLAPYMRPYLYLFLHEMPILPNGKKDYRSIVRLIERELA